MSNQKTGGPAFPTDANNIAYNGLGMTLRDYFAAKAMQAYIQTGAHKEGHDVAAMAYIMADDMLDARRKLTDSDLS